MGEPIETRSSSWGDLMDCAHRWEGIYLLGMKQPASVPAHMGTSIHKGSAVFDRARVEGRDANIEEAVQAAVENLQHPDEEVDWRHDEYSKAKALDVTIRATEAYCTKLSPLFDYRDVEMRPAPLEVDVDGQVLVISGQMDRTRIMAGQDGFGIGDVKTGKMAVDGRGQAKTSGFKFQLGIYELLAEHTMNRDITLPANIVAVSTGSTIRTGVGTVTGAKALMLGTQEKPGIIETAGKMIKQGLFPPNPRSMLCSEKYCPRYHFCKAHD